MDTGSFLYTPLGDAGGAGAIRLLRLQSGVGRDLECELIHAALDDENTRYEAVSYTWGSDEKADKISIGGKTLPITLNLSLILRDLRSPETERTLWIDAICINQHDNTERGHQVQKMKDIFRSAERVLFCVSRSTDMTDLLMTALGDLQMQSSDPSWILEDARLDTAWTNIQNRLEKDHFALRQRQREGLEHIFSQPWWSRIWILQEVANARDGLVYCGKKSVPASIFAISPRLIDVRQPERLRYQPVLDLMPGPSRTYSEGNRGHDLYSLLRTFPSAKATEERDKIYALLGMCTDMTSNTILKADYVQPIEGVIRDTGMCKDELVSSF